MRQLTREDEIELARGVLYLMDEWQIPAAEQIALLGLPGEVKPRHLERYRRDTPFPHHVELHPRIEALIAIYDALRTSFPRNPGYGMLWMAKPNRYLCRRTPLRVMLEDGLAGMEAVRRQVDCTRGWY